MEQSGGTFITEIATWDPTEAQMELLKLGLFSQRIVNNADGSWTIFGKDGDVIGFGYSVERKVPVIEPK